MLLRYSGSTAGGTLVTAALIYGMHLLVDDGDVTIAPRKPVRVTLVSPPPPPPLARTRRDPPPPPEPRSGPPQPTDPIVVRTTDAVGPVGPVTPPGPARPPGWPVGRQGPWAADSELTLAAQIRPAYPHAALARELEGSVLVEFTVTRQGRVEDIRVLSSSHTVFEGAAIAAVARFRYRPRIVDGIAVDVPGIRTVLRFELDD